MNGGLQKKLKSCLLRDLTPVMLNLKRYALSFLYHTRITIFFYYLSMSISSIRIEVGLVSYKCAGFEQLHCSRSKAVHEL